jgi:hypothetical protein
LADGIAKSIFLVCITVRIQVGAVDEIDFSVHPDRQVTALGFFDLEFALGTAGLYGFVLDLFGLVLSERNLGEKTQGQDE